MLAILLPLIRECSSTLYIGLAHIISSDGFFPSILKRSQHDLYQQRAFLLRNAGDMLALLIGFNVTANAKIRSLQGPQLTVS